VAWSVRPSAYATVAGVAVALLLPLPAAAGERDAPAAGPLAATVPLEYMYGAALAHETPAMRTARARTRTRRLATEDGYSVDVEVTAAYADNPSADQALVDFLGSRLHGPELGALRVYVGTPREIVRLCGGEPDAVACYAVAEARMYVPGERVKGIPVEYAITHEYGHHLASRRSNDPWDALDWGAKHWASATRVCTHVKRDRLFPGNQGAHYFDDPGEGFADGYAHLHFPDVPWHYNELMRPGRSAFAAIRRDVLRPWVRNRTRTFRGRLGPGGATRAFRIRLTLDGELALRLTAPRGGSYSIEAATGGFASGQVLRSGHGFGIEWCRRRRAEQVTLTVRRREGRRLRAQGARHPGRTPFTLTASWPG
jgi:hypothetical protein